MSDSPPTELLRLLVSRLERLSADSRWSHRASGLRGNMLKVLEEAETKRISRRRLDRLIDRGFEILREAAREIPDINDFLEQVKMQK
jgi:hypothetical protein